MQNRTVRPLCLFLSLYHSTCLNISYFIFKRIRMMCMQSMCVWFTFSRLYLNIYTPFLIINENFEEMHTKFSMRSDSIMLSMLWNEDDDDFQSIDNIEHLQQQNMLRCLNAFSLSLALLSFRIFQIEWATKIAMWLYIDFTIRSWTCIYISQCDPIFSETELFCTIRHRKVQWVFGSDIEVRMHQNYLFIMPTFKWNAFLLF